MCYIAYSKNRGQIKFWLKQYKLQVAATRPLPTVKRYPAVRGRCEAKERNSLLTHKGRRILAGSGKRQLNLLNTAW